MTPFHVGMKVVCIEARWVGCDYWVNVGEVLEIFALFNPKKKDVSLGLIFTISPKEWFASQFFRPVHENRMDELRSLLTPIPSKAKEGQLT